MEWSIDHWNDLKVLLLQSYTSLLQRLRGAGRGGKTQILKRKKVKHQKILTPLNLNVNRWWKQLLIWTPLTALTSRKTGFCVFLFQRNLLTWQCNFIFPNDKDYFIAQCNHIVKSNKKWSIVIFNNFRLARLAAPLLAAALNKVFKIVLLNSHQGHNLFFTWLTFFLKVFKIVLLNSHQGHKLRKSRLTFFSRLAWWRSSNVVSRTTSWRRCWKRRDYKEGGLDKKIEDKKIT